MNITPIINTIIGLLFTVTLLSLAVMYLNELVAAHFNWRSSMLETTIRNMLSDAALADQLYNHPLIRSLYSGAEGSNKPSYIPASAFSQALLDIVSNACAEASLIQEATYRLRWELPKLNSKDRNLAQKQINVILALTRRALVSEASADVQENSLKEIRAALVRLGIDYNNLKPAIDEMMTTIAVQRDQIQDAIENSHVKQGGDTVREFTNYYRTGIKTLSVTHPRLKQTLGALLSEINVLGVQPEGTQQRARQNLEEWFNNSMDRLSGWYRRRAQTLAYAFAISLVLLFNIDTLSLAARLWQYPAARNSAAEQALLLASQNPGGITNPSLEQLHILEGRPDWLSLPVGWMGVPVTFDSNTAASGMCSLNPHSDMGLLGIPVLKKCYLITNMPAAQDVSGWILKILGLLITVIAAAQGAPFWFDVLKRLINIRISGANPVELNRVAG
jgi:hypothetical protein